VKTDADLPVVEPRPTRAWLPWAGAAVWISAAAVAIAITERGWPTWLQGGEEPRQPDAVPAADLPVARSTATNGARTVAPPQQGPRPWAPIYRDVWSNPSALPPAAADSGAPIVGPAPSSSAATVAASPSRTTCEGAVAAHRARVVQGRHQGSASVTAGRQQAALDNGSYLASCGVAEDMAVSVCAAIQRGRAVGVTVHTTPTRPRVQQCIADAVREVEFTSEPQLDVTKSHFDPL
jgi:uncharacterized protein with FMN-binding domain